MFRALIPRPLVNSIDMSSVERLTLFISSFFAVGLSILSESTLAADDYRQAPLTSTAGDAQKGKQWLLSSHKGNCLLCHRIDTIKDAFQGNIGPSLSTVGDRLSPEEIRFRLVDSTRLLPQTIMPAYFKTQGLTQVANDYQQQTILSAQEIEDIVAYLAQLKRQTDPNHK